MASSNDNWNSAPEYFVELLVRHLKQSKRWSRDGRSLRALNRHWRAVLDRHITKICPHRSRSLDVEDLDSLLKFPNIETLYTFEYENKLESQTESERLLSALSMLPRLNQLSVSQFLSRIGDQPISHLTGVTSLLNAYYPPASVIERLRCPLQELSGCFHTKDLVQLIKHLSTLKILEVHFYTPSQNVSTTELFELLMAVETLKLDHVPNDVHDVLDQMTNVVSLSSNCSSDVLPISARLTRLVWEFPGIEHFGTERFRSIVKRLKSLRLYFNDYEDPQKPMPADVLEEAHLLESLELWGIHLTPGFVEDLIRHPLTSLCFWNCQTQCPLTFLGQMTTLHTLELDDVYLYDYFDRDLNLRPVPPSHLKELTISLDGSLTDTDLMKKILCLTQLECLDIRDRIHHADSNAAFIFESLDALSHLSSLCIQGHMPRAFIERCFDLKMLTTLDALMISVTAVDEDEGAQLFLKSRVRDLKDKAPHLKYEVCDHAW